MTGQLNFTSSKNFMKRDTSSGTQSVAAPVTVFLTFQYATVTPVAHNLGFIPIFRVYYEPFKDGVIWPALGNRTTAFAVNPRNAAETGPYLLAYPDSANLTVEIGYSTNVLTGTYPIYYVIYKDYGH